MRASNLRDSATVFRYSAKIFFGNKESPAMYEVILYAAIATIVCVVLYTVLGKSVGQGPDSAFDPIKALKGTEAPAETIVKPVIDDRGIAGLGDIMKSDPQFNEKQFIDGAKGAYSIILEAFAEGEREELKGLLTTDVYTVYDEAITERETKNLTQVTDLGRLISAEIVAADKTGKTGQLSVRFEAELTSALVDSDGKLVQGDPDVLSRVSEVWTFERVLNSSDPNWRLSDVAPSDGDSLEADPSPDTKA